MRRLRENGLSVFFGALFLASLCGQAIAGHAKYNQEQVAHAQLLHEKAETLSLGRYVTSTDFGRAVMENWQSEYLQFVMFILASIYFVQRGSAESKPPGKEGRESDEEQKVGEHADAGSPFWVKAGGWRTRIYSDSLLYVMLLIFLGSWFAQSVNGWSTYNADQIEHRQSTVTWLGYLQSADFWEATLQNWQSEFLAVGSVIVFTIYLRARGSPQSKPVGAAHHETAVEG
jgi:hypothetical protein